MISPGAVETTNSCPSRWVILKLIPERACKREIFLVIERSAPFLSKTLCFSILTTKTISPAIIPGASSPSPVYTF